MIICRGYDSNKLMDVKLLEKRSGYHTDEVRSETNVVVIVIIVVTGARCQMGVK